MMPVPAIFQDEQALWSEASLRFAGVMVAEAGALEAGLENSLALAAALTVRAAEEGHSCIELASSRLPHKSELRLPAADCWLMQLSGVANVVGQAGDYRPLLIDQGLLYLNRYWCYEKQLAEKLLELASRKNILGDSANAVSTDFVARSIEALFPDAAPESPDWQRLAVALSTQKKLTVIAGGPGTGKTTTLVSLLALNQQIALQHSGPLRIRLAAPTGKAAARMQEAVEAAIPHLWRSRISGESSRPENASDILKALPKQATTLHSLLGYLPGSPYFRHHAKQPLPVDLLVVDEASMVDLAMMAKLVDALPDGASLVLMGDRDQLASVEAGSVLGDICRLQPAKAKYSAAMLEQLQPLCPGVEKPGIDNAGIDKPELENQGLENSRLKNQGLEKEQHRATENAMADSIVVLQTSRRFAAGSGIGALAAAVNAGDSRTALATLKGSGHDDIELRQDRSPNDIVTAEILPVWRRIMASATAESALAVLAELQLLCATRVGQQGVEMVNRLAAESLLQAKITTAETGFFAGLPLIITRNDPNTDLANGDTGLVWPDADGRLTFHINDGGGNIRRIALARLPDHEPSFAMTVHKSQGSEFDRVVLLFPENAGQAVSRELLYTAITRARKTVVIHSLESVLVAAVRQRVQRASGLSERLGYSEVL